VLSEVIEVKDCLCKVSPLWGVKERRRMTVAQQNNQAGKEVGSITTATFI
jgi:hypothetical protein